MKKHEEEEEATRRFIGYQRQRQQAVEEISAQLTSPCDTINHHKRNFPFCFKAHRRKLKEKLCGEKLVEGPSSSSSKLWL